MEKIKKIVKKTSGLLLILLGLFALFTPMTPGAWMIFIGLELAGFNFFLNYRLVVWLKKIVKKGKMQENILEKS